MWKKYGKLNNLVNNAHSSKQVPLAELKNNGAQKQTVLGEKLGSTPGTMTNIANKLVKQGYAKWLYNENERRNVLMEILPLGEEVLKAAHKRNEKNFFRD